MTDVLICGQWHEAHTCPSCGVIYTCPKSMLESQRKDGKGSHFCANGHSLSFRTSENDRLRQERDRLKQDQARLEEEVAARDRTIARERKEAARLKKRAAAGVCPCCHRTVGQMARHMKSQHPDYNVVPLKAAKA